MNSKVITTLIALATATATLTGCSPQSSPVPTATNVATAPTASEAPEAPVAEAPTAAPTGPTQAEAEELSADVVLAISDGSNAATHEGVTYNCDGDVNAPIIDGAPLDAASVLLFEKDGVITSQCVYELTDEQLFG